MKKIAVLIIQVLVVIICKGQYTILHNFNDTAGGYSFSPLIISGDTLYGTTFMGGTTGAGVVFSVQTNGSNYKVLHNFLGTDGQGPYAGLTLSGDTLYGTTSVGGADSEGVIFSIHTNGTGYKVLY